MDITIQENEKVLTAILNGRLDSLSVPEVEQTIFPLIEEKEYESIILDMTEVNYIASSGLRLIFIIFKNGSEKGARVILKGVNDFVREVLNATGLAAMFEFE